MKTTVESAVTAWVRAATGIPTGRVYWGRQGGPVPARPYIVIVPGTTVQVGQDWVQRTANPLVVADFAVTADASANTLTKSSAHGLTTGDGPFRVASSGTLPGGLAAATDYWVIKASTTAVKFAATHADAVDGTAIDLSSAGSGVHTISDTADTEHHGEELISTVSGNREVSFQVQCFGGDAKGDASPEELLGKVITGQRLPTVHAALRAAKLGVSDFSPIQTVDGFVVGTVTFEARAVMTVRGYTTAEATETSTYIESVEVTDERPDPDATFTVDRNS